MILNRLLASLIAGIACFAAAQSTSPSSSTSTSTYVVGSTSAPVAPDNYESPYRPQIHFSPPINFMNDPNGLFIDDTGLWHLYYQFNPTAPVAGDQHWGHATSPDLYQWTVHKNAIAPSEGSDPVLIFSGSAARDPNNTSGLFPSGNGSSNVLAFYTGASTNLQAQDIAYSTDNGYTFTKYSGNPVINYNSSEFRDPKVFWHAPTSKWVMAVAFSAEYKVGFFTSSDAKSWTATSNFSHAGLLGVVYECPNLVEVPVLKDGYASAEEKFASSNIDGSAWLLVISINPGAPLGGSISQYFPGSFNGTHFEAYDDATRLTDWAKDNYAAQFWDGIPPDQGQVMIPWASNWQYTNDVPTVIAGFRSVLGVPRITGLAHTYRSNWTMISAPYPIPSNLLISLASSSGNSNLTSTTAQNTTFTNMTTYIDISQESALPSGAFTMRLIVTGLSNSTIGGTMNFTLLATSTSETLRGGYILGTSGNTWSGTIWLDRGGMKGYTSPLFTSQFSNAYLQDATRSSVEVLIVVDRGIIEIFMDGGVGPSGTAVWFESEEAVSGGGVDLLTLSSSVQGDGAVQAEIQGLRSAWHTS